MVKVILIAGFLLCGAATGARAQSPKIAGRRTFKRAIVTVMFDDGYASVHDVARPILKKYGFKSTDFIVSGAIGKSDFFDHPVMPKSEIDDLARDGDEIESHSVTHPHLPRLTPAQLDDELSRSKAVLEAWYPPIDAFALPYGESNAAVMAAVKKHYRYCRTSRGGYNELDDFDPYRIRVQAATSATTLADIRGWLAHARTSHSWLAILYHDIGRAKGDLYTMPPERFQAQMRAVRDSGLPVLTMRQAVGEIRSQLTERR
jgi:peptidoglycan/xylan/chitin deacetylase (PgdA/CDA1 family)